MKTLKITLALVAVLVLTISGVQSDNIVNTDENPTYETYDNNVIAHKRGKAKLQPAG
ncbi:hypothetical protein [Winogradskyella sp. PE311]|uniref:hypothetical protein n=1 Tax=Winogradskyella sp. PE311 TaxID=3366943 RepID=UPI00397EC02E